MADGCIDLPFRTQRHPKVTLGFGVVGFESDSLLILGNRFVELFFADQGVAKTAMCDRIAGFQT